MTSHPTADELLAAVKLFLEGVAPQLKDRDAFLVRVAVNAIGVVRRELEQGESADDAARARLVMLLGREDSLGPLNLALCDKIKNGEFDADPAALLDHLRRSVIAKVQIDQPNYSGLKAAL